MYEFLVYTDVLMSDIESEAKYIELRDMNERALSPYLFTADHTGLETTLLRDWEFAYVDDDYSTVQLWLAADEEALKRVFEKLPLVQASRMTIQHITRVTHTLIDPGLPKLRNGNRHGNYDRVLAAAAEARALNEPVHVVEGE